MVNKFITSSYEETEKLGEDFAKTLNPGDVVCLFGNLGAGKTTFVKGIAKGLGISTRIISPTFVIVRSHKATFGSIKMLYHIDLYRLGNKNEISNLELKDILEDKNAVTLVEWPEMAIEILPKNRFEIHFEYMNEKKRKINIDRV